MAEEEKQEIAEELASIVGEIEEIEKDAKEAAKSYRDQLEPLKEKRTNLARAIRNGYREVDPQLNLPDT